MELISACGNHMNPPLSYIDPSHVGKIEVFAGITPVSLGGDSLGGTIVVESEEFAFAGKDESMLTSGSAGAFYRSNGDAHGADISVALAGEQFSLNYSGSTAQSENYHASDDFKAQGRPRPGAKRWTATKWDRPTTSPPTSRSAWASVTETICSN